jgi:hypothetical protein
MTNADVIKLIQAGLPEAAIVNKIQANAGSFDTSTDALIALKKAGATDAELAAITAVPPAPVPVAAPVVAAQPVVTAAPVEVFGGQLMRTRAGDPYIQFPAMEQVVFLDGRPSNSAYLAVYQGEPAILIPARGQAKPTRNETPFVADKSGNLLFMKGNAIFDWYLGGQSRELPLDYYTRTLDFMGKPSKPDLSAVSAYRADPGLLIKRKLADFPITLPLTFLLIKQWVGGKVLAACLPSADKCSYPYFYIGGGNGSAEGRSAQLQLFVEDLQKNFDSVLAVFEQAAGITNLEAQLSPGAHYQLVSENLSERYDVILQQRIAEQKAQTPKTGVSDLLTSLNQLNDAVNVGSGIKTMGSGLAANSGSQIKAGLQQTTAASNALGAVNTQAQYAANAQMQAANAQAAAVNAQAAASSPYAATTQGNNVAPSTGAAIGSGKTPAPASGQPLQLPARTFTLNVSFVGPPAHVTTYPEGINCPSVCSFTWQGSQQLLQVTVTPPAGYVDNAECTGTAPITPGGSATCMLPMMVGTTNEVICVWKAGTPNPCYNGPAPTAILPSATVKKK